MWFRDEQHTPHNAILTSLINLTFIKIQRSNNTVFVFKRLIKKCVGGGGGEKEKDTNTITF